RRLSKLFYPKPGRPRKRVIFVEDCVGEIPKSAVEKMNQGDVILLENLRFYPGEENNDSDFAKQLAELGDIFVNDAFGVSHRAHASTAGITKFLPSCAGFLLKKEINALSKIMKNPKRPLVSAMGGVKISSKLALVRRFIRFSDKILIGGALAATFFKAAGFNVGKSVVEENMIPAVKKMRKPKGKVYLPVDVVVCSDSEGKNTAYVRKINEIKEKEMILDIGPETCRLFAEIIGEAKTIFWNGPMGLAEVEKFSAGSKVVAKAIARAGAYKVIGGGDAVAVLDKLGLSKKINHISTGGGAMLEFLAGKELPGIKALKN
ncbi:MAG: phosphoglycerate kinase, partial [Patescibacteria group bacterium]